MSGFRVNTNVPAIFSQRQLGLTSAMLNKNLEKLSSGFRINRAGDDAAGLAVSERFRTQINGLKQAEKNIQDGISMMQTAEGGVVTISDMLQRLRTLAVQSANDTLTTYDRATIQLEFNQIIREVDRQASTINFNSKVLLKGSFSSVPTGQAPAGRTSLVLQVGANKTETLAFNIFTMTSAGLGVRGLSVSAATSAATANMTLVSTLVSYATGAGQSSEGIISRRGAESAIAVLSRAIDKVNGLRAEFGAIQNRLERTYNFVTISRENQSAAESRIRDLDFADEIVNFTKNQILQQAGTSALAQANVAPQSVLQLLK